MSKRTTGRIATSLKTALRRRSRAAVVTAGLCASVVATGSGVAAAADTAPAEAKDSVSPHSWVAPVSDGYTLTAPFAVSGNMWSSTHSGQDFAVPSGTAVDAVHSGTVVKAGGWGAGDGPAYGNAVVIDHGDGTYSQYAHLSSIEVGIGEWVTTGEEIALSGNTGNSTGPHLHFEIRTTPDYGSAIDPMQFLRGHDVTV
jgi:murein DD-endopeptidase MepM/ murein hydrolase activator NlpD